MEWAEILTVFVVVATNLITVVTLHIHLDNKTERLISIIQAEMKDFHGRMCAIEERGKK
jgi:hypothetical protein